MTTGHIGRKPKIILSSVMTLVSTKMTILNYRSAIGPPIKKMEEEKYSKSISSEVGNSSAMELISTDRESPRLSPLGVLGYWGFVARVSELS